MILLIPLIVQAISQLPKFNGGYLSTVNPWENTLWTHTVASKYQTIDSIGVPLVDSSTATTVTTKLRITQGNTSPSQNSCRYMLLWGIIIDCGFYDKYFIALKYHTAGTLMLNVFWCLLPGPNPNLGEAAHLLFRGIYES